MEIILKLLKTDHEKSPLRTEEVRGFITSVPEVGSSLILFSQSETENYRRVIKTSAIKSINPTDYGCNFTTQNSTYQLLFADKQDKTLFSNHRLLELSLKRDWDKQERQLNVIALAIGLFAAGCIFTIFMLMLYFI